MRIIPIHEDKITVRWDDEYIENVEPIAVLNRSAVITDEDGHYTVCVRMRDGIYTPTLFINADSHKLLQSLPKPEPSEFVKWLRKALQKIKFK